MSNVSSFREFLENDSVHMDEFKEEDGSIYFRTEQRLKNGGSVILVAAFTLEEDIVDLFCFNIASITNPLKKELILELINELNADYRYSKFYESEGTVSVKYSFAIDHSFDPNQVFRSLVMLLDTAEDTYPKFMKLLWS